MGTGDALTDPRLAVCNNPHCVEHINVLSLIFSRLPVNSESTRRCLVYGGTSGMGLEVSKLLTKSGYIVDAVGRNAVTSIAPSLTFHSLNPSESNFRTDNRSFLMDRADSTAICIFNIGGSFGSHEKIASVRVFTKLSWVNSVYIIDTIEAIEDLGYLKDMSLVFILTNALKSNSGNPSYLMHKAAIEKYAEYLATNCAERNLTVVLAYPPLLLYPLRHLPQLFMSLKTDAQRQNFVEDRLFGQLPISPAEYAIHLVKRILKIHSQRSSISNLFRIYGGIDELRMQ